MATNGIADEITLPEGDAVAILRDWLDYKINRFDAEANAIILNTGADPYDLYEIADMVERDYVSRQDFAAQHRTLCAVREQRDEWKAKAESALHENAYVGLVRGKQWERTEISDYYCGKCGWKVTDHDSYCPECGGALHKASNKPDSKFDARKTAEMPETDTAKGDIRDFDVTNLEWYAKNDLRKLLDLGIDGNMSCDDCPNQCVETEEGTLPEECQRRLLEWLMAPHANDDSTPENDVSADDVDANDANATQDMDNGECVRMCPNDSREKLEADVITTFGDGLVRSIIMRLLDRQVAITCTEQREWWGDVVAELQEQVDTLTRYIHEIKQIARKV